jgi:hypothetical protein
LFSCIHTHIHAHACTMSLACIHACKEMLGHACDIMDAWSRIYAYTALKHMRRPNGVQPTFWRAHKCWVLARTHKTWVCSKNECEDQGLCTKRHMEIVQTDITPGSKQWQLQHLKGLCCTSLAPYQCAHKLRHIHTGKTGERYIDRQIDRWIERER